MSKIIIVEDDNDIREELKTLLSNNGYDAEYTVDFETCTDYILNNLPDLVLLDVNLGGISGLTICDKLRRKTDVPIIFVTGNNTTMDELNCIMTGGDDYISKPYQIPILLARIAAVLKRTFKGRQVIEESKIICKNVTLDTAGVCISVDDNKVELTKNELKIMYYLMKNEGNFIPRADIIDYLWDNDMFIDDNTLSVNVTRIRNKLESLGVQDFIETKRGIGYRV